MNVAEIEAAIARLAPGEQAELRTRLARQAAQEDPLLALLGSIHADVPDLAERHDDYLGQALAEEARHGTMKQTFYSIS